VVDGDAVHRLAYVDRGIVEATSGLELVEHRVDVPGKGVGCERAGLSQGEGKPGGCRELQRVTGACRDSVEGVAEVVVDHRRAHAHGRTERHRGAGGGFLCYDDGVVGVRVTVVYRKLEAGGGEAVAGFVQVDTLDVLDLDRSVTGTGDTEAARFLAPALAVVGVADDDSAICALDGCTEGRRRTRADQLNRERER
jgi:hypothetical protein